MTSKNQPCIVSPGSLLPQAAPYIRAILSVDALLWALLAAALAVSAVGWVFYGPRVPLLVLAGLTVAALTEWLCAWITHRYTASSLYHSLAMGVLVVLMLPVGETWYAGVAAAAVGTAAAVAVGKWLMGGLGHYPWHPAAVGVIALYMLWPGAVTPERWPVLAKDHLLVGNGLAMSSLENVPVLLDWSQAVPSHEAIGFNLPRPERVLQQAATARSTDAGVGPVTRAVRDLLPSTWDTLIGAVAAPIGQGSSLALIAAGLLLIWRGYLRWSLPLAVLAGAAGAAAILPAGEAGWLPVRYYAAGQPVGLIWASYHVLLGSTLFAAVLLAGETVTSPLTRRGQIIYGLGVGVLTVGLRWWPMTLLSSCWAVLAMNTVAGAIDWLDRRWRLMRGG